MAHAARAKALARRGPDRPSDAGDREAQARALRQRSERKARLLDQMEMQLEDCAGGRERGRACGRTGRGEDDQTFRPFARKRPSSKPFPEHLPRSGWSCRADLLPVLRFGQLSKLGEDITETLEVIPRQWKVIQTVREKFTCRDCERITQPPAPFHPTPRGFAGPNLLAMILFEKFGQHQPLNRQSERYAREGIDLSLSTLADQVGACVHAAAPASRPDRGDMSLPPSGCTATTPRCRSWPRARR